MHAENTGKTLCRVLTFFANEKTLVVMLLVIVSFGTVCAVLAPSLQT